MSLFARRGSKSFLPFALFLFAAPLAACSSQMNGTSDDSAAAVTDCAAVHSTPTQTKQTDGSGNVVSTTMTVDASGCIASDTAPSKLVDGLVALVEDDTKLAN